jgi:protein ImuB
MRPGAALIDVSGLGRLIGEPADIARELERAIREAGLTGRVALAPTTTAARLLAMAQAASSCEPLLHGLTTVRAEALTHKLDGGSACGSALYGLTTPALASLPVTLLAALEDLPDGMPARDRTRPFETLERWGIATLGQFAALPAAALSSRLGRRGTALQRLARGLDAQPFVPDPATPRYIERLELEWPIDGLEPLSFVLARLLEPLAAALERADRGAAAVRLDLRLVDRSTHARVLQLPAAMRDPRVLRTLLLLDLESHPPPAAIDVVAIEVDPAPARVTQFSLLERARPSPETLSTLMARLGALVGADRCGAAVLVDTHRPGAFAMVPFSGELRVAAESAAGAVVGDVAHAALRRRRVPLAVRVRVEGGRPVHVAIARRGAPSGAVIDAAGPWRSSGSWWHDGSVRWDRDEWDVALADRTICRLFHDRATRTWFLDGTFD